MSYCRWSSSNFACDLYVYEDVAGCWTIHVAGNRVVGPIPEVVWPADDSVEARDRFVATQRAQHEFLMAAKREPITLPHVAETFHEPTALAAAERVEQLQALGYRVPDYVARDLRAETESDDA